jgi:hypothetical protein
MFRFSDWIRQPAISSNSRPLIVASALPDRLDHGIKNWEIFTVDRGNAAIQGLAWAAQETKGDAYRAA